MVEREFRRRTPGSGGIASQNQRGAKEIREGQERGNNPKAQKAYEKRRREERFLQDLPEFQFRRALKHIIDGDASEEDFVYVVREIYKYEQETEKFTIVRRYKDIVEKRITEVSITMVEFTRH